ncbi:MAG TPA: hypothetical protein VIT67_18405 [Povalibacter sp.]
MSAAVELSQVQRLILFGPRLPKVRHFFLTVVNATQARSFMRRLEHDVAFADSAAQDASIAVALTYNGLQALRVAEDYLDAFRRLAPEFIQGAATRAAEFLGDTGRNEAPGWEPAYRSPDTHMLLTIHAQTEAALSECVASLRADSGAAGFRGWDAPQHGARLDHTGGNILREHFGFRDGISQPVIRGLHDKAAINPESVHAEAGEFLLGYVDEDGANRWSSSDVATDVQAFVRNGSFIALRKMQQHVDTFGGLSQLEQAKMCGRWHDGAVVQPGERTPPVSIPAQPNQFDFRDDPAGHGCPFSAHIRRINPRGDRVIPPRKRLLMRRGIPYGSKGEADVGLLGVFICASLARQFEFLLAEWVAEPPMAPGTRTPDPVIGPRFATHPDFTYPMPTTANPAHVETVRLRDYVTTRGTLYGFYPSRKALGMIGALA